VSTHEDRAAQARARAADRKRLQRQRDRLDRERAALGLGRALRPTEPAQLRDARRGYAAGDGRLLGLIVTRDDGSAETLYSADAGSVLPNASYARWLDARERERGDSDLPCHVETHTGRYAFYQDDPEDLQRVARLCADDYPGILTTEEAERLLLEHGVPCLVFRLTGEP